MVAHRAHTGRDGSEPLALRTRRPEQVCAQRDNNMCPGFLDRMLVSTAIKAALFLAGEFA